MSAMNAGSTYDWKKNVCYLLRQIMKNYVANAWRDKVHWYKQDASYSYYKIENPNNFKYNDDVHQARIGVWPGYSNCLVRNTHQKERSKAIYMQVKKVSPRYATPRKLYFQTRNSAGLCTSDYCVAKNPILTLSDSDGHMTGILSYTLVEQAKASLRIEIIRFRRDYIGPRIQLST
jgi:hypothetical protein